MKYLQDTNTAQDFIQGEPTIKEKADRANAAGHRVGISITVLAELTAGAENSQSREKNLLNIERSLKWLTLWPFEINAARFYGRIMADLKRRGRIIGSNDVMIASTAFALGSCTLVTIDSDFQNIPGLRLRKLEALTTLLTDTHALYHPPSRHRCLFLGSQCQEREGTPPTLRSA